MKWDNRVNEDGCLRPEHLVTLVEELRKGHGPDVMTEPIPPAVFDELVRLGVISEKGVVLR